jgi:hypothetical protein
MSGLSATVLGDAVRFDSDSNSNEFKHIFNHFKHLTNPNSTFPTSKNLK